MASETLWARAKTSIGTLGGGNHYEFKIEDEDSLVDHEDLLKVHVDETDITED